MPPWSWRSLPRRARRLLVIAGSLLALYAIVGFFVVPPILRSTIEKRGSTLLGRPVRLEQLRLNPFTFSMTARGFELRDTDNTPLLRWDRLFVDFQLYSIAQHAWRFRDVELGGASGRVVLLPDGNLNITDLINRLAPPPPPGTPPEPPVPVSIGRLKIDGATLNFIDRSMETPFTTTLGPVRFEVHEMTTHQSDKAGFNLAGKTEAGEAFTWQGGFSLAPLGAEGSFSLQGVDLTKYRPYYRGTVPFEIRSGNGDLKASYRVEWSPASHILRIENAEATTRDLGFAEPGHDEIALGAPTASVRGTSLDLLSGEVRVGALTSSGGRLLLRQYPDGSINLLNMILPFFEEAPARGGAATSAAPGATPPTGTTPAPAAPVPATAPTATPPGAATEPLVRLEEVAFTDWTVEAEDQALETPVRVVLDQVALALKNVDNRRATTSHGTLDVRWMGEGTLHAEGDLSLVTFVADLQLSADKLDLTPLSSYADPFLDLRLTSGLLSGSGHVKANPEFLERPEFSWTGDLRVERVATVDGPRGEPFLGWRSFSLQGLEYELHSDRIRLREASLVKPEIRLALAPDGSSNVDAVLRITPPPAEEPAEGGAPGPAGAAQPTNGVELAAGTAPAPTTGPATESGTPGSASQPATNAATAAPAAAPAPASATTGLITVGRFAIRDGVIRLVDTGVTPPLTVALNGIEGAISGLSSRPGKRAKVGVTCKFEGAAPVTLQGETDPLTTDLSTDLTFAARGVDMSAFSPWAGRWLGYTLQKGKLDVDMKYLIEQRRLAANNLLVADQLTLGEKTDSPVATKLPVRLGLALLRDRNGVIKLDVPVEGSLDDPRFRLGRVILHAIANVFGKLVTSPFTLLARAFAGGKDVDLSIVDFDPGLATVGTEAAQRLDTLVTALYERPDLRLEIAGATDEPIDTPGLRRARLESMVKEAKWRSLGRREREETPAEAVVVGPEERPRYVKAAWKALRETLPGDKSEKPETPEAMESWMLERIVIAPEDLRRLAADRAAAVRDRLAADGKVEAARLFIADSPDATGTRVVLKMQ